jgi:cation/acetate symporter
MKNIVNPNLTDKEEVRYARIAAFVSLLIATYFGINPPSTFIAETVAFAFGLAASSFFPTLLMGIFWKKLSREGAIAGMACGIGFTLGYIIYFQFMGGTEEQLFWGIIPQGIGFVGMLINFTVAFVVNLFSPPPPQHVQEMVESIHIPTGSADVAGTD